ncbi:MAG: hydroxymethylbilane synthase [Burkholderiales bacterium]|nr:hydroxymethylbilane synthase [Burkholderiales bacterium]
MALDVPDRIVIASRASALALWQAEHVRDRLQALYPGCAVSIASMSTRGDRILDRSLAKIGGKGLFVKELENALEAGEAHIAVHSMKDVPMVLPDGFSMAAISAREDPRDAFVSNAYRSLDELPAGARIGTSSLRREAQLRARFPALGVQPLRGNVQTRLLKLDEGGFDAIILAAAGLKRLGLGARISAVLSPEESLPAPGQGALGIECLSRRTDLAAVLAPLGDEDTARAVQAERTLSRLLGGSCQVPLGAYGECAGERLRLRAFVATPDGRRLLRAEASGPKHDPEALGMEVAAALRAGGADAILRALGNTR